MTSAPGSSGPCSTRTSSGWRMHSSTSSTGRTSDDCGTSKSIWGFGRRTTDSEVIGGDAVEVAAGFPVIAALEIPFVLWISTAMAAPPEILLYAGGILALVLMAMLLVRPLLFTFLIV